MEGANEDHNQHQEDEEEEEEEEGQKQQEPTLESLEKELSKENQAESVEDGEAEVHCMKGGSHDLKDLQHYDDNRYLNAGMLMENWSCSYCDRKLVKKNSPNHGPIATQTLFKHNYPVHICKKECNYVLCSECYAEIASSEPSRREKEGQHTRSSRRGRSS